MKKLSWQLGTVTLGLGLLLCAGCGGSTGSDDSGSGGSSGAAAGGGTGGGSSGAGGSGGAATGGSGGGPMPCTSLVPCCDSSGNAVDAICDASGMPECPPGSSFPASGTCTKNAECSPNQPCQADEFCDYADNLCGSGDPGACKPRPEGCNLLYAPVCTCEGKVAGNECGAHAGGSDVNAAGGCPAPSGTFECGEIFCAAGQEYCEHQVSDVVGDPSTFQCKPLPQACGSAASCQCVQNEPCGFQCKQSSAGHLTLTCPGG